MTTTALLLQQQLQLEQERRRRRYKAPATLIAYARHTEPTWDWDAPHLRMLGATLDGLRAGSRQCIEIPIRHGKSELATIRYAAREIIRTPSTRVMIGCNSARLAQRFSRKVRNLVRRANVPLNDEKQSAKEWETTIGGGCRSFGIGGTTAGEGCDLLILDDPIANREAAESDLQRERVWESITNDFLSRLEPDGIAVLTMSRWHAEDPIGRLRDGRAGQAWAFLRLPGRAEANDPLGRAEGDALWPTRWPIRVLEQRRLELGELAYWSLIQQAPQPRGGSMFKWDWWRLLDVVPVTIGFVVRYWDIAGTEPKKGKHDPDWTVGVLMGQMEDKRYVVLDVSRVKLSIGARDAHMRRVMLSDVATYGYRLRWWVERPTGMGGADQEQAMRQAFAGIVVQFESPTTDKQSRAAPLASHCEGGLVCLAPGEWRDDYRLEFSSFPRGKHDDQVDGTSGAFSKVALPTDGVRITQFTMG